MAHRIVPIQLFFFSLSFSLLCREGRGRLLLFFFFLNFLTSSDVSVLISQKQTQSTALIENKGHLLIFTVEKKYTYKNKQKKNNQNRETDKLTPSGGDVGSEC